MSRHAFLVLKGGIQYYNFVMKGLFLIEYYKNSV